VATLSLRGHLKAAARQATASPNGLWAWLRAQVDLAQYQPQALPGAAASHLCGRDGPYVILKNPQAKTYYRLTDHDFYLWEKMDGTKTVKELVVAYFMAYRSFAFARVASLVQGLKQNRLLVDQPVNVYGQVHRTLEQRRMSTRLMGLWAAFMGKQFAIGGLDGVLSGVYRWGGRLLFSWPALILYLLISTAGLYAFYQTFNLGGYGVVNIGGSYVWGMVGLAVVYLAAVFIHELSHALTVKHYRREVRRGGFMLYMGMPGFFIDTTDIWMEEKRARLAVTWAGPYSGLVLGGLASLVMFIWTDLFLNAVLFQFAFMTYLLVFFNLNPLLELDGYYLLMDWLEIPALRRKSLQFLRTGLVAKLRGAGRSVKAILASFSREERIFTIFGVLSAAWTAYALYSAGRYYQVRIASAVRDLWTAGGSVGRTVLALAVLVLTLPIAAGLVLGLWGMARNLLHSAARHGWFRGWNLAATLLAVAVVLAFGPGLLGNSAWQPVVSLVALAAAAGFAAWNAVDSAGSHLAPVCWLLAGVALALWFREAVAIPPVQARLGLEPASTVGAGLGLLAALLLFLAGMRLFSDTDLKQLGLWEKGLLAVGLAASYALALLMAGRPSGPLQLADLAAIALSLASLLALLLLASKLVSFWGTGLAPAWALLTLAAAGLLVTAVLGHSGVLSGAEGPVLSGAEGPALSWLLLAAGGLAFHLAYAGVTVGRPPLQETLGLIDVERLDQAFAAAVGSLRAEWRSIGGNRETRILVGEFNNYALAAGWRVQVDNQGAVQHSLPPDLSLAQRGERYAAALTLLLDMMAGQVGEKLTVRGLQRAYDGLPWDHREVAAQVLFPHVRRAEALSREFKSTQQNYWALLRRIPLFATMYEEEIDLLCSRLLRERFPAGQTVIRQGDPGDRFYVVEQGHLEVTQRDARGVTEVVDQLDRGRYFGELALLRDAPRNATCRATVPTELLSLSRPDFDRLVRHRFELREKVDRSISTAALLRRVPLFADLDAYQIQLIAAQVREQSYAPGDQIIRQGEVGETFYVIESGRVQTSVRQAGADMDGGQQVVAERGPGEYVGEIALLMQVPRTATVRALTPVTVLALEREDFDRLVASHLYLGRGLEREASRRLMGLRRAAQTAG
jgi:putative peptide zinc metalloprotease protein